MVTIQFHSRQCPNCGEMIYRDFHTGPGKWYWCDDCSDYTIHPNQKFLKEVAISRQDD